MRGKWGLRIGSGDRQVEANSNHGPVVYAGYDHVYWVLISEQWTSQIVLIVLLFSHTQILEMIDNYKSFVPPIKSQPSNPMMRIW